jgi:hypothetical protein
VFRVGLFVACLFLASAMYWWLVIGQLLSVLSMPFATV